MNSQLVSVDFSKKIRGTVNSFSVPVAIQNAKQMAVKAVSLVNNVYLINSYTNRIPVDVGSGTVYATLVQGNYTANALATEMASKLTALGVGTFTVSYSSTTNKFSFVGPVPWYLEWGQSETNQSLWQMLGFEKIQYDMSSPPYTIVSPQQIRLTPIKWIDFCSMNLARVLKNQGGLQGSAFYRLYVNDYQYGQEIAFYEHYRRMFDVIKNNTLGEIDIEMRDDQGRPTIFEPNADVSVLLEFFC